MSKLVSAEYDEFHKRDIGTYTSWLVNDINQFEKLATEPFYKLLNSAIGVIVAGISLFFIHWSIVLAIFFEVAILLLIPRIFKKKIDYESKTITIKNENFVQYITDYLSGYNTMYIFQKLHLLLNKFMNQSYILSKAHYNYSKSIAKVTLISGIGNILCNVSMYALAGYLAFIQQISIGSIAAISAISTSVFNSVANISPWIANIKSSKPILEKFNLIEIAQQSILKTNFKYETEKVIEISNLSFNYMNKQIIKNITYSFEIGKKYLIIGGSGTGKSTLLDIISGKLKNYQGSIKLFGAEVSDLTSRQIQDILMIVDQKPYIFNASVRENLQLDDEFTDIELLKVLENMELINWIKETKDGLDTNLGEKGKNLSGGQIHRIALSRALLRNKNILLLDEITANLDPETAGKIEQFLFSRSNLTIIMVTHRINDRLLKMVDGILQL